MFYSCIGSSKYQYTPAIELHVPSPISYLVRVLVWVLSFSKYSTWRTRIPSLFTGLWTGQVSVEVRFTYVSFLNNDELHIFFYCFFHKTFKNDDGMIINIS